MLISPVTFSDTIDDDVEEQQKFCAVAIILARALIHRKQPPPTHPFLSQSTLPKILLQESPRIITRADFIHPFDHIDITHSDATSMVYADSVPMQNAFCDIVSDEGFEEPLRRMSGRLDEREGLARTREVSQCEVLGRRRGDVPVVEYCILVLALCIESSIVWYFIIDILFRDFIQVSL
ncbi:hypothetical protein HBI88_199410 [Parastagonospora nodorum]|nr:hypothetical protein HBI88_199410 [Parastagonospora nodorum]KAH6269318.1 hypothetical protein HBI40_212940 [Parastagonospora nodorum]